MTHITIDVSDYTFIQQELDFQPTAENQPIPLEVFFCIISDDDKEIDETFNLTIEVSDTARETNITEGQISVAMVLIEDDDGKRKAVCLYRRIIHEV